jgi:hypothetical protein
MGFDRDHVRLQFRQSLLKAIEFLCFAEGGRQLMIGDPPFADTDHLEAGNPRVSERVAHAHIAEADNEDSLGHPF